MIESKLVSDILDLLLDGDNNGRALRPQIDFLSDTHYNYTGVGLFVTFSHIEQIIKHRSTPEEIILNGVDIKDEANNIDADATLFIKNGFIDCLEIWSKTGDYPKNELESYTLTQIWIGSPGREIKK